MSSSNSDHSLFKMPAHYPGADDNAYCMRRREMFLLAFYMRMNSHGDVPDVSYSDGEHATWRACYAAIQRIQTNYASSRYLQCKRHLRLDPNQAPQLATLMEKNPGLQVVSAEGLLTLLRGNDGAASGL